MPDPHDRLLATERETSKLLIQAPQLFESAWDGLTVQDFTHPAYAAVFASVEKAAQREGGATGWVHRVASAAESDLVKALIASLAVEPLVLNRAADKRYARVNSAKLQLLIVSGELAKLKSKLQRTNPVEQPTKYNQMFSELVVLEARRTQLQARSQGGE